MFLAHPLFVIYYILLSITTFHYSLSKPPSNSEENKNTSIILPFCSKQAGRNN